MKLIILTCFLCIIRKLKFAKKWNIKILNIDWIFKSIEAGGALKETEFLIDPNNTKITQTTTDTSSALRFTFNATEPDPSQINSTFLSNTPNKEKSSVCSPRGSQISVVVGAIIEEQQENSQNDMDEEKEDSPPPTLPPPQQSQHIQPRQFNKIDNISNQQIHPEFDINSSQVQNMKENSNINQIIDIIHHSQQKSPPIPIRLTPIQSTSQISPQILIAPPSNSIKNNNQINSTQYQLGAASGEEIVPPQLTQATPLVHTSLRPLGLADFKKDCLSECKICFLGFLPSELSKLSSMILKRGAIHCVDNNIQFATHFVVNESNVNNKISL